MEGERKEKGYGGKGTGRKRGTGWERGRVGKKEGGEIKGGRDGE